MLFTAAYVEQNALLHTQREDYGANGGRMAPKVSSLMREYDCATMLDYGCGKGSLVKLIPGARGYDPALPEFSRRPEPADLVVCSDVLEHIEPECLDDVLEDLRSLAYRVVFLVISCRPAYKTLPDGRNAHLIVENQDWWMGRLMEFFRPGPYMSTKDELIFVGHPLPERKAVTKPAPPAFSEFGTPTFAKRHDLFVQPSVSVEHIKSSCARGLPTLEITDPHDGKLALCAYGPSLNDFIETLRVHPDVMTVSGAHEILVSNGIRPRAHVEADAHAHKAQMTASAGDPTKYYLASRCHPDVFDNVCAKAKDVTIWHLAHSQAENEEALKVYPGSVLVQGAVSVAGRALCVAMVLGYRHFEFFGLDCSFPWDEAKGFDEQIQHAGKHPNPQDVFRTDPIRGVSHYTTLQLFSTADQFLKVAMRATTCTFTFRGKGLMAYKARELKSPRFVTPDLLEV